MVNLLSRDQAMKALSQYDGLTVREFAPDSSFGFKADKKGYTYTFGDKDDKLPVSEKAWDYIYRASGLPGTVIGSLSPEVHQEHVVPIVDARFRQQERDMKALLKGGQIVGFAKGDTRTENPFELFKVAEKIVGKKHIKGYQVYGDLERAYFSIIGDTERKLGKTFDRDGKRVGAVAGYGFSNYTSPLGLPSPGGNHSLELNGFNWIYQCTNGAISTRNIAHYSRRLAGDTEFEDWYPEEVRRIYGAAEEEFDRLAALKDHKLPKYTAEMLDGMMEQYGVPPLIRGRVADRLINFPVDDLLGVWNHITYVASNYERALEDHSLIRRLQLAAASIVANQHICDKCHQLIKPKKRVNAEVREAVEEAVGRGREHVGREAVGVDRHN
jgi:hypothetical protein